MKISVDIEFIKQILVVEDFYNKVPEYFFLKDAGAQIVEATSRDGGCTACTERNLIDPTTMAFIAHAVNMYFDCGPQSMVNFKEFMRKFKNIEGDFHIAIFYKENDESEIVSLNRPKNYFVCIINNINKYPSQNTDVWKQDKCSRTLRGCRLRFNDNVNLTKDKPYLPFGAFPATFPYNNESKT